VTKGGRRDKETGGDVNIEAPFDGGWWGAVFRVWFL
jgi:hypothetical protein